MNNRNEMNEVNFDTFEESSKKRLSEKEALVYHQYATEKESIGFSEKASEESYAEAELILMELNARGISIEGVELSKLDLRDALKQDIFTERLEHAIASLASSLHKKDGFMEKINEALGQKGIKKIALLLSLFSVLTIGETSDASASSSFSHQYIREDLQKADLKKNIIKIPGAEVSFWYSKDDDVIRGCKILSFQGLTYEKNIVAEKLLIKNWRQIIIKHVADSESTGIYKDLQLQIDKIELEKKQLFSEIEIYQKLKDKSMRDEADYVGEKMIFATILKIEEQIGAEIFDRDFLGKLLFGKKEK